MGSMPPRSKTAILWASILSFLALPPWIAFMYRAWPRTKGISSSWQRSASQYQANRHSQATTSPSRKGGDGAEKGVGAGTDGLVQADGTVGIEEAEGKGPGVQIAAAVESVLLVVESHHGLRGRGAWLLVTPVYPLRRGHDEYPTAAADRRGIRDL